MHGACETIDGRPAVRFERRLSHPVEKVRQAVTDPAELALSAADAGCVLRFTHVLEERDTAARDAAGWHVCLDRLGDRLDGGSPEALGPEATEE